jgi:hypothetical protein
MIEEDEYRCPSCAVPLTKHLGLFSTCAENIQLKARIARVENGPTMTIPRPLGEAYVALVQAVMDHQENLPPIVLMAAKRCQS